MNRGPLKSDHFTLVLRGVAALTVGGLFGVANVWRAPQPDDAGFRGGDTAVRRLNRSPAHDGEGTGPLALDADVELPQGGFEFEFASTDTLEGRPEHIDPERYRIPLEIAAHRLGVRAGLVHTAPWWRRPELGAQMAYYLDPDGRRWQVVPESVNTPGLDGFEFITPPLRTDEDFSIAGEMVDGILSDGRYGRGLRSGSHFTVDVASLVDADGNASRLVDSILFIENHWPELYGAISPVRYGTIVNRFGIPLAAEQPALLRELAAMPPAERTFERVRAVFARYHEPELALRDGDANRAWKYRAANYGKLFGLGGRPEERVIEFRIPDLPSGSQLSGMARLFRRVMALGHRLEPGASFRDPFAGARAVSPFFAELNDRIYRTPREQYRGFLSNLRLTDADYPWLAHLEGPPSLADETVAPARRRAIDFTQPVRFGDRVATFGFEAEFRGPRASEIVTIGSDGAISNLRRDRFPFLIPDVSREGTGNIEVRSAPSDNLATTLENMRAVHGALAGTPRNDLRGFHLHFRVPIDVAERIPGAERNAWLARIADRIHFWRLQHRDPSYSLDSRTVGRAHPSGLAHRSTLRVQTLGAELDIEIRGFMDNIEGIREVTETILTGFSHPELVRGFTGLQELLYPETSYLVERMDRHFRQYRGRGLTDLERTALSNIPREYGLPSAAWVYAPYLSQLEVTRVQGATLDFERGVMEWLQEVTAGRLEATSPEGLAAYRSLVRRWATHADMESLVARSLLNPNPLNLTRAVTPQFLDLVLQRLQSSPQLTPLLENLLNHPVSPELRAVIARHRSSTHAPVWIAARRFGPPPSGLIPDVVRLQGPANEAFFSRVFESLTAMERVDVLAYQLGNDPGGLIMNEVVLSDKDVPALREALAALPAPTDARSRRVHQGLENSLRILEGVAEIKNQSALLDVPALLSALRSRPWGPYRRAVYAKVIRRALVDRASAPVRSLLRSLLEDVIAAPAPYLEGLAFQFDGLVLQRTDRELTNRAWALFELLPPESASARFFFGALSAADPAIRARTFARLARAGQGALESLLRLVYSSVPHIYQPTVDILEHHSSLRMISADDLHRMQMVRHLRPLALRSARLPLESEPSLTEGWFTRRSPAEFRQDLEILRGISHQAMWNEIQEVPLTEAHRRELLALARSSYPEVYTLLRAASPDANERAAAFRFLASSSEERFARVVGRLFQPDLQGLDHAAGIRTTMIDALESRRFSDMRILRDLVANLEIARAPTLRQTAARMVMNHPEMPMAWETLKRYVVGEDEVLARAGMFALRSRPETAAVGLAAQRLYRPDPILRAHAESVLLLRNDELGAHYRRLHGIRRARPTTAICPSRGLAGVLEALGFPGN